MKTLLWTQIHQLKAFLLKRFHDLRKRGNTILHLKLKI